MPQSLPRPDARTIRRIAALESAHVSEVLWAAGDLLRGADSEGHIEARSALARVAPSAALAAIAEVDAARCARAVEKALEGAFDAALEDDAEEREQLELAAMEDLEQRDAADCVLCAVTTFDGRSDVDPREAASLREAASTLRGALVSADERLRPRARALTAVNERRRERAAELDDAARAGAWWWSELAGEEHDGLVELLAGRDMDAGPDAVRAAEQAAIPRQHDALGAALRALDGAGPSREDATRWAESAAKRTRGDAIALELARTLDVSAIDEEALT